MSSELVRSTQRKSEASLRRDQEKVRDGLNGYLRIANALAYRYYRYQLPTSEDREQAVALAALEALNQLGSEGTLREVTTVIRHYLYQQSKAYGFRMVNSRRTDGKRTASWTYTEMPFSVLLTREPNLTDFGLLEEVVS